MQQQLGLVTLVVSDYDEALAFYVGKLGFALVEDTAMPAQNKRWVVISPPGSVGAGLLLAQAKGEVQERFVGNQAGGRVMFILYTDNFWRDHAAYTAQGVKFQETPRDEPYGIVAVFADLYGNLWDLIQRR
jgi:catechol 2,3-dioxygenase-like lactoylglutathione lyase family enzyme